MELFTKIFILLIMIVIDILLIEEDDYKIKSKMTNSKDNILKILNLGCTWCLIMHIPIIVLCYNSLSYNIIQIIISIIINTIIYIIINYIIINLKNTSKNNILNITTISSILQIIIIWILFILIEI